jgi:hypothetical protein
LWSYKKGPSSNKQASLIWTSSNLNFEE